MKKHSYRELNQRRFAGWILFFLNNPDESKDALKSVNTADKRDTAKIKTAYNVSNELIKQQRKGQQVNLYQYSPYRNEIKAALIARTAKQQQGQLF